MAKKITFVLPDSTSDKLDKLKTELDCSTFSPIAALSIEILNWVVEKRLKGYEVKAEKKDGSHMTIEKCPLIMPPKT